MNADRSHTANLAIVVLWVLAATHVLYTASCVINYSMAHPFLDQFRLNLRYLTVPFPLSIFEIENGHRPVLPGLVRWLELRFFHGSTWLEFATAWGLAIASLLFLLREISRTTSGLLFAMAGSTVCVLLLWNANARMFVHPYEAQHVFYISAALTFALLWRRYHEALARLPA